MGPRPRAAQLRADALWRRRRLRFGGIGLLTRAFVVRFSRLAPASRRLRERERMVPIYLFCLERQKPEKCGLRPSAIHPGSKDRAFRRTFGTVLMSARVSFLAASVLAECKESTEYRATAGGQKARPTDQFRSASFVVIIIFLWRTGIVRRCFLHGEGVTSYGKSSCW